MANRAPAQNPEAAGRIVAVVTAAGDASVPALLAGEALKRAAAARGRMAAVEIRTGDGVLNPVEAGQLAGATLLRVGGGAEGRFAGQDTATATIDEVLADAGAVLDRLPAAKPAADAGQAGGGRRRIVAVTSCPTGIAHTFMAADGLGRVAAELGHDIRVETQGSVGAGTPLTPDEIAAADLVLIAADRQVDLARFGGKRVYLSGTKPAINDGKALLARAFADAQVQAGGAATPAAGGAPAAKAGPYKHLMTGVSFMLPFVVSGRYTWHCQSSWNSSWNVRDK